MASVIAFPWARTGPAGEAVDAVSGFGHGGEVVLTLAGIGALAVLFGNRRVALLAGCVGAVWTAVLTEGLSETLSSTAGVGVVEVSWGAFFALTGSVVLAFAAVQRPRASGVRAPAPTR